MKPPRVQLDLVEPLWLSLARQELGTKEAPGTADNPRIVEYLKATSLAPKHWHDSTAHCAAFVSWCLQRAGLPNPRYAMARKYLEYGQAILEPQVGAIAVFSRGNDKTSGHVGFFVRESAERIEVLGANQANTVSLALYPKARLLGYRMPRKATDT